MSGGTGKWKGLTGKGTIKVTWQRDLANGWAAIIRHEATWQVK